MTIKKQLELPPGWDVRFNVGLPKDQRWIVICATGHEVGRYECREVAVSRSWIHFGLAREQYQQLKRDSETLKQIYRDAIECEDAGDLVIGLIEDGNRHFGKVPSRAEGKGMG